MSVIKANRTNTYIYSRVSGNQMRLNDNDPTSPFISSDYQISRCISYAKNNLNVNGPSVFTENRPSFSTEMSQQDCLFQLLKDDNIHIIFLRVDRFSRCFPKAFEIIDKIIPAKKITLHFVEEGIVFNKHSTSGIKQLLTEALMKAHVESDNLSRRLRDINTHKKKLGNDLGPPPYGMKIIIENGIRKKVINEYESNIIDFIKKIYNIKEFNNDKSISFRVLNTMLMKLTNDTKIREKIKNDPIQIWNSKVTSDDQKLTKGFDAEDIAFILNDKGIKKRNLDWTKSSVSNIISNERKRKRSSLTKSSDSNIVHVDNERYIENIKKKRNRTKYQFHGNTGQSSKMIQDQMAYTMNSMTM